MPVMISIVFWIKSALCARWLQRAGAETIPRVLGAGHEHQSFDGVLFNGAYHDGSQGSQSSESHNGRELRRKPGLEAHAGAGSL
jgi:hypothetical protein